MPCVYLVSDPGDSGSSFWLGARRIGRDVLSGGIEPRWSHQISVLKQLDNGLKMVYDLLKIKSYIYVSRQGDRNVAVQCR